MALSVEFSGQLRRHRKCPSRAPSPTALRGGLSYCEGGATLAEVEAVLGQNTFIMAPQTGFSTAPRDQRSSHNRHSSAEEVLTQSAKFTEKVRTPVDATEKTLEI